MVIGWLSSLELNGEYSLLRVRNSSFFVTTDCPSKSAPIKRARFKIKDFKITNEEGILNSRGLRKIVFATTEKDYCFVAIQSQKIISYFIY